jgi:SAM-dependent methyltransferase
MAKNFFLVLPEWAKNLLRLMRNLIYSLPYFGKGVWCPVCGKEARKFRQYGHPSRDNARCIHCQSLERHRFVWTYLHRMTNLFDGSPKRVLHVAPESCFESRLKNRLGQNYITADLLNRRAMVRMDITDIQYPEEYFDVIYCSHVFEHVQDDKRAMREFHRVLKQDGWAILLVPIDADKTFENPSIVDPSERLRVFGQEDHVRRYGPDYIDRLCESGFKVRVSYVSDLFGTNDVARMGLTSESGEIYYCCKV